MSLQIITPPTENKKQLHKIDKIIIVKVKGEEEEKKQCYYSNNNNNNG